MTKHSPTCYMCAEIKTSMEHIPPKSFFPKNSDHRNKLITVPSCDIHNQEKSDDDLYVLLIISAQFFVNQIGLEHFQKSVLPRIKEKPYLFKAYNKNSMRILLDGQETIQFEVDKLRFNRFFECMARGLYFFNFGEKWLELLHVEPLNVVRGLRDQDINDHQIMQRKIRLALQSLLSKEPKFGSNREIFYFQFHREEPYGIILRIVLYEEFEVLIFSKKAFFVIE